MYNSWNSRILLLGMDIIGTVANKLVEDKLLFVFKVNVKYPSLPNPNAEPVEGN